MSIFVETTNELLREGLPKDSTFCLQVALKLLGFMPNNYKHQCDGILGRDTIIAIRAVRHYCKLTDSTNVPYSEINRLLGNIDFFKVPVVDNPERKNKEIVTWLDEHKQKIIFENQVPYEILKAILWQETGLRHYDPEGFLFVGCDFGIKNKWEYRSRGWGIGQYTIQNHPPNLNQLKYITEPLHSIEKSISILKEKFRLYVTKKPMCIYIPDDEKYLSDCQRCVATGQKADISLPQAIYHPKAQIGYKGISLFDGCGWPLAVERYNGAGNNAKAYRYEVLAKLENRELR
ncbi:MAG: hypothetical protein AB1478_01750 [Nitrospirota bacterium]